MTNSLPPDPERRRERDDEWIAAFVALAAIGTIVFLGLARGGNRLNLANLNPLSGVTDDDVSDDFSSEDSDTDGGLFGFLEEERIGGADREDDSSDLFSGVSRFNPFNREDSETDRSSRDLGVGTDSDDISDLESSITGDGAQDAGDDPSSVVIPPVVLPETPADETDEEPLATEPDPAAEEPVDEEPLAQPIEPIQEAIAFSDVSDTFWAKPFIDSLSERGIISGFEDNRFDPEGDINRAQFAASIQAAFGDESLADAVQYTDVTSDYWANDSIQKASDIGFMSGYPEGDFRPENQVTRLEVLVALVTGLGLATPDDPESFLQAYQDRAEISEWAIEKIAAATEAGLVVNHPTIEILRPSDPATRAEASAMIYQALRSQNRVPAVNSVYIVSP
ncbi:MAG: S-layer homology domain-containing protein [Cyanobacteria bacterium J06627_8]